MSAICPPAPILERKKNHCPLIVYTSSHQGVDYNYSRVIGAVMIQAKGCFPDYSIFLSCKNQQIHRQLLKADGRNTKMLCGST